MPPKLKVVENLGGQYVGTDDFDGILFSILIVVLFLAPMASVVSPPASSTTIALPPIADAEVRELSPDSNHGTSAIMWVRSEGCGKNRRAFLKFDLSAIPANSTITEARLHLYCQVTSFADLEVQVRAVDNDGWAERTLTWNNQPPHGEVLDAVLIPKCAGSKWYSWEVTSFVQAEFSGDKTMSLCLRAEEENGRGSDGFRSKEHGFACTHPYLKVVYVPPVYGVAASISPRENSGPPGASLNYVVTIANLGSVGDTYALSVSDNAGWSPMVSPSSLTVPPGENRTATLGVTVPSDALGCTRDNVLVTAVSQSDPMVKDNDSCIAHAAIVRGVNVSVSPSHWSGLNGVTLTYTVTVANTGNVSDTYSLTTTDNAVWGPSVFPTPLTVPPRENSTATLSVTVPLNAIGCTNDNILVTATGTGVGDSDSCIAHVTILRGVQVAITPPSQENENGGTLTYTVTVNNTGNVQENFQLTKGDNSGWPLNLDDDWLSVPRGENRTTRLTVHILMNARGCTWDNIYVKATSSENENVWDNESCLAHVKVLRGVEVSISPGYQSGPPGATLSYTVTVTNTGNVPDNYALEKRDNRGWAMTLPSSTGSVNAGASDNKTLWVTIPENAENCTRENIIVIATSLTDNRMSDNVSCVAHVMIRALLGQPILYLPANGSKTNDNTPTFKWICGENAASHRLLVDNNPDFSSPEENHLLGPTDNTYTVSTPLADDNYSWKVIAINENGENESDIWTFIIDTIPPSAPRLLSPENNDNITDNTPTFRWTEPETPENYTLVIDDDADFGSPTQTISNITDNTYTLMVGLAVDNYYWRVRAIDEAGNAGDWAENFKLTILREKEVPRLPSKPQLYSPANGSKVGTLAPTLRWENGLYAENHRVLIDIDDNPDDDPLYDHIVEGDNKWTTPPLNDNTTYWWKVIAQNENGENHSVTWHFTVVTGVPPPQPQAPPFTRWPFIVGATAAAIAGITAALYKRRAKNLRRTILRRCSSRK